MYSTCSFRLQELHDFTSDSGVKRHRDIGLPPRNGVVKPGLGDAKRGKGYQAICNLKSLSSLICKSFAAGKKVPTLRETLRS